MAFGAIFGLRVVRWLLVLRDARLRVGRLEATRGWTLELRGDLARARHPLDSIPWYPDTMDHGI